MSLRISQTFKSTEFTESRSLLMGMLRPWSSSCRHRFYGEFCLRQRYDSDFPSSRAKKSAPSGSLWEGGPRQYRGQALPMPQKRMEIGPSDWNQNGDGKSMRKGGGVGKFDHSMVPTSCLMQGPGTTGVLYDLSAIFWAN